MPRFDFTQPEPSGKLPLAAKSFVIAMGNKQSYNVTDEKSQPVQTDIAVLESEIASTDNENAKGIVLRSATEQEQQKENVADGAEHTLERIKPMEDSPLPSEGRPSEQVMTAASLEMESTAA